MLVIVFGIVTSPSMRREWIEIRMLYICISDGLPSPSMRREWIEMLSLSRSVRIPAVSLHAEGVALVSNAAQLSQTSLAAPKKVIGKNTLDCLRGGMIYGNAASIDGMIERMEEELGCKCTIVATGGLAQAVIPHCRHNIIIDEDLLLKGLQIIYEKNR